MRQSLRKALLGILCGSTGLSAMPPEALAGPISVAPPAAVSLTSPVAPVRHYRRHYRPVVVRRVVYYYPRRVYYGYPYGYSYPAYGYGYGYDPGAALFTAAALGIMGAGIAAASRPRWGYGYGWGWGGPGWGWGGPGWWW